MSRILVEHSVCLVGERVRVLTECEHEDTLTVLKGTERVHRVGVSAGSEVVEFEISEAGVYELVLEGAKVSGSFAALERPEKPPLLAIVFHNHQAPNYSPDGSIREPWAFKHVWDNEFHPYYRGGAYYLQAALLSSWRMQWNANLSPSLLKQWADLLDKGIMLNAGGVYIGIDPDSPTAGMVRETLEGFRELVNKGLLELMTSFYSHPLAGYLADAYGWLDILREELKWGKGISVQVMGVEPKGLWLPELSFSMKLTRLMRECEIEFTVLDSMNHFTGAVGDKGSIYEPYLLDDVIVFFRHTGLSDLWSFKYSNVKNPAEAEVGARDLALRLVLEAYVNKAKPLTVALDGENWMILPEPKPFSAILFNGLLEQLKWAEDKGLVKLVKLSDLLGKVEPRKLVNVPSRSWRGGYDKWLTDRRAMQEAIWSNIVDAYELYKAIDNSLGCGSEETLAVMHTVNSDHIWAEFADESYAREWAEFLKGKLQEVVSSIKLEGFTRDKLIVRWIHNKPTRILVRTDGRAQIYTLQPGLNELYFDGSSITIALKGWTKEVLIGKPIVKYTPTS
ncbi:MAG: hypothetical protein QW291_07975 [Thermofilaceae archaeon]